MILNLSPLQSKALFTFEFIGLGRVLSNLEIPFQALQSNDDPSLRLGAKKRINFAGTGLIFPFAPSSVPKRGGNISLLSREMDLGNHLEYYPTTTMAPVTPTHWMGLR